MGHTSPPSAGGSRISETNCDPLPRNLMSPTRLRSCAIPTIGAVHENCIGRQDVEPRLAKKGQDELSLVKPTDFA
jgi:hypothetical protein